MSVEQYPKLRSDKARLDRLADRLDGWEANLLAAHKDKRPEGRTFTFDEAHGWKLDAELDLIAEIRDMIAR